LFDLLIHIGYTLSGDKISDTDTAHCLKSSADRTTVCHFGLRIFIVSAYFFSGIARNTNRSPE
jgi:hypothetical protein